MVGTPWWEPGKTRAELVQPGCKWSQETHFYVMFAASLFRKPLVINRGKSRRGKSLRVHPLLCIGGAGSKPDQRVGVDHVPSFP